MNIVIRNKVISVDDPWGIRYIAYLDGDIFLVAYTEQELMDALAERLPALRSSCPSQLS